MTTPITRAAVSMVSLSVAFATASTLGGCAAGPAPITRDGAVATPDGRLAITFDNEAETYVDVYLVTPQRQWQLGRVGPGAKRTLLVPDAAITTTIGFVRLAVLAGAPLTLDAAHDPHAAFTILQSASELFSQRWTFLKTPLASAEVRGVPLDLSRR